MRTRKIFARVPPEAWKDPQKLREFADEFARRLEAEYERAQREHQEQKRKQN